MGEVQLSIRVAIVGLIAAVFVAGLALWFGGEALAARIALGAALGIIGAQVLVLPPGTGWSERLGFDLRFGILIALLLLLGVSPARVGLPEPMLGAVLAAMLAGVIIGLVSGKGRGALAVPADQVERWFQPVRAMADRSLLVALAPPLIWLGLVASGARDGEVDLFFSVLLALALALIPMRRPRLAGLTRAPALYLFGTAWALALAAVFL